MSPLDKIAPYPKAEQDATADTMAAHFAAFSLMHQTMVLDHFTFEEDRDQYMRSIGFTVSYYGLAHLLREVKGRAGAAAADRVAKDLWLAWEDGSSLGEWCWEWLERYGVDPEGVRKVAASVHANEAEKAEPIRIKADGYAASREDATGRVELEISGSGKRILIDLGDEGHEILAGLLEVATEDDSEETR